MPYPLQTFLLRQQVVLSRWAHLTLEYRISWAHIDRAVLSQGVGWRKLFFYRKHVAHVEDRSDLNSFSLEDSELALAFRQ